MAFKKCQRYLHKNFPNEVLVDPLLLLFTLLNELSEIAPFAMLHHYIECSVPLVDYLIVAPDDILMLELSQNIDLINQLIKLLFSELSIIDLLPYHLFR
jgi:hypothetical protein